VPGIASALSIAVPESGFFGGDWTFAEPFPGDAYCVYPPIARVVVDSSLEGFVTETSDSRATRIEGTLGLGMDALFDTSGNVCAIEDLSSYPCTFAALRNGVEAGSFPQTIVPLDGASITFNDVTAPGIVTVTQVYSVDGQLPADFQVAGLFFDVETTATYSGGLGVCLPYPDVDDDGVVDGTDPPIQEDELRLLHVEGGVFVDRTDSRDAVNNWICGDVPHLSGFALGKGTAPLAVDIDIKPGSDPNAVNLGSHGLIPAAILSSDDFDATTVNPETVTLSGAGLAVRGKSDKYMAHAEDVNDDGLLDLVVQVETENLAPGAFQNGYAVLTGSTDDGLDFQGRDEITIVPSQ
jgi:hypothetical protein